RRRVGPRGVERIDRRRRASAAGRSGGIPVTRLAVDAAALKDAGDGLHAAMISRALRIDIANHESPCQGRARAGIATGLPRRTLVVDRIGGAGGRGALARRTGLLAHRHRRLGIVQIDVGGRTHGPGRALDLAATGAAGAIESRQTRTEVIGFAGALSGSGAAEIGLARAAARGVGTGRAGAGRGVLDRLGAVEGSRGGRIGPPGAADVGAGQTAADLPADAAGELLIFRTVGAL